MDNGVATLSSLEEWEHDQYEFFCIQHSNKCNMSKTTGILKLFKWNKGVLTIWLIQSGRWLRRPDCQVTH